MADAPGPTMTVVPRSALALASPLSVPLAPAARAGGAPRRLARRGVLSRLMLNRAATAGGIVLVTVAVLSAVGPFVSPHDPIDGTLSTRLQPPSLTFPLGTDGLGRDIFSRLLHGGHLAFQTGLTAVVLAGAVGTGVGLVAGFYGGLLDGLLMSGVEILLAFPYLLLALLIVSALGPGLTNAMLAVGIVTIPQYARLVRGTVLAVREKEYVLAARAAGASGGRILLRHVLVNSLTPIIVQTSLGFGFAIVSAATLSFLGLGAQPPTPEWGAMLSEGREYMAVAPWVATFPGLAILLTVVGCNLLGDGLRDTLDPYR